MGNRLIWDERYNVGVDLIDREHKKLFGILNKLFDLRYREEKSRFACQEAVKYFKDHAIQHFTDEENYMMSINYTGLQTHRRIHKDFRERMLPALENELELTHFSETSIQHFLGVCAGWLIGHTLIEDHLIVDGEPVRHWEKLLPEEEQAVMGQTIANLLYSMFHLNSQLISNCYAGENFGTEICCRLIYSGREEKRWEFFLLFEENLIGSTIGNVIDTKSETTDMMLCNVASYAAKQLAERVKGCFSSLKHFEFTNEHLLSYEQFYRMYQKLSPQFSLLFDTGKGYFACCMAVSETPPPREAISAITADAVAEIESRLHAGTPTATDTPALCDNIPPDSSSEPHDHNTPDKTRFHPRHDHHAAEIQSHLQPASSEKDLCSQKKKILVVDDSDFMRTAMLHLLGSDYEVLTADSGLSAIRSITTARPDLMLLDYEMPVCNGGQTLEMIRSEKDFTDIPVIFLTSRVDRESVKKAISLKPEGYLSKSLSAESVKREIDHFFEKRR